MKLKSTYFKGLLACAMLAGTAASSQAYILEVNSEGDMYTKELDNGVYCIFGVEVSYFWNEEEGRDEYILGDANLWRIEGRNKNVDFELPTAITFTFQPDGQVYTRNVNYLGYRDGWGEFWECERINLTVPATYEGVSSIHSDNFKHVNLTSAIPPQLFDCYDFRFSVPAQYYDTYQSYVNNGTDGWGEVSLRPINPEWITINSTANNLEDLILADPSVNGIFENVYKLKINGSINGRDMNVLSQLRYLEQLDLSGAEVVSDEREDQYVRGCGNLRWLEKVVLSPNIVTIDQNAFESCNSLKDINLENVKEIKELGFYGCDLRSVDLSNLCRLGQQSFYDNNNLSEVKISDNLVGIDFFAFGNTALESFEVPATTYLGDRPFAGSSIKTITCYDNSKLYPYAFWEMGDLQRVNCYDPIPSTGDRLRLSGETDLYVPAFAFDSYYDNSRYYDFHKVYALAEDVKDVKVENGLLELNTTEGLANNFDLTLGREGRLINYTGDALNINNFNQTHRYTASNNYGPDTEQGESSYFISNSDTKANNVTVKLGLTDGFFNTQAWNFISFPFNVKVSDIIPVENALWTIREYDGKARAEYPYDGNSKWIDKRDGTLEAGKGYIIHYSLDGAEEYYGSYEGYYINYFTFPAVNDTKKNNIFNNQDVTVKLNYYDSENDHNKSWNLIGNPYDAYYDINYISYSDKNGVTRTPITVWRIVNGQYTYEAFSADDEFSLRPFEAFFVQGISEDFLNMKFSADGRIFNGAYTRSLTRGADALEGSPRHLFNLHIAGENSADRTRLVINEDAEVAYEITRDASKFLAPGEETAQIYMIENNEKLAINERPFGAGEYNMGVRIGKAGEYTISCDTRNANGFEVILKDNLENKEINLSKESYTFVADKGSDSRFYVKLNKVASNNPGSDDDTTGVAEVASEHPVISINGETLSVVAEGEISVYSIDGKEIANGTGSLDVTLAKGVYVIKTSGDSVKAVIR